jgi:hypothetical protein
VIRECETPSLLSDQLKRGEGMGFLHEKAESRLWKCVDVDMDFDFGLEERHHAV